EGVLDAADVGDLAAEVEMDELEAVLHPAFLEVLEGVKGLGEREAELGAEAGAVAPAACPAGGELDADADDGPHAQLLGVLDDRPQLGELLDDGDDLLAHLAGQHGHLDELVVLEAVADDGGIAAVGEGEDGEQLRLGAGLETEAVRPAVVEDLLD